MSKKKVDMNDLFTKFDFEIEISGNQTQQKNWIFLSDPIRSMEVETRFKRRKGLEMS